MCLIIYSPTGQMVERDVFDYAQAVNSDGIGIMSRSGVEKFVGRKCKKRAWRYLMKLLNDSPSTPFGVHFRWRTHGDVTLANTHPYLAPMSDAAVMHNGIIASTQHKATGKESDTAIFVRESMAFAPDRSDPHYETYYKSVATAIGYENKLLVLHRVTGQFTLVNEDAGFWNEGLWYSNDYSIPGRIDRSDTRWEYDYAGQKQIAYNGWISGYNVSGDDRVEQCTVAPNGRITRMLKGHLPTVRDYMKMTPEEQEYADSMVSDTGLPRGYYESLEAANPTGYYDEGADTGGNHIVTGADVELALDREDDERRYSDYLERKWREQGNGKKEVA